MTEEKKEISKNVKSVLEEIKKLTIVETAELVHAMEEEFGVSASAPMAMMAAPVAGEAKEEEKSSFDIELTSAGGSKINVIKVVKELTGLGLKEAKDMVDAAPKVVKEGVAKDEAEKIKAKLEEAGASVTLK